MIHYLLEHEAKSRPEAEEQSLEILGLAHGDVKFEVVKGSAIGRILKSEPVILRTIARSEPISHEALARGVLMTLLHKMGTEARILQVGEEETNLYIEIEADDSGFIIGKHGRTLDTIQYLLNLVVSMNERNGPRIILDVSGYRKRRKKNLEAIVSRMADRVHQTGRPLALDSMNPYERRQVHIFLENDNRVYTSSMGEGVYKRVRIIPQNSGRSRRGGPRRGRERQFDRRFDRERYDEEDVSTADSYWQDLSPENMSQEDMSEEDMSQEDLSPEDMSQEDMSEGGMSEEERSSKDLS